MTNEEAKEIFSKVKELPCGWCYEGGDEFKKAINHAIKAFEERPQGDLKSVKALKAYAREVLCGNNPTNSLLIRMFDEIIDNAPPCNNLQQKGGAE